MLKDSVNRLIPVLGDFGVCQIIDPSQLRVKAFRVSGIMGASVSYAAPEIIQLLKSDTGARMEGNIMKAGDVFALAVMIQQCLVRRTPWWRKS